MKFKEMAGDGVQPADLKRMGKADAKVYVHKDGKTILIPASKKDEYMAKGYKLSALRAEDKGVKEDQTTNDVKAILDKHGIKSTDDIEYGSDAFSDLFDYFSSDPDEMPYGVQKARTGMPDEWIANRLIDLGLLDEDQSGKEGFEYPEGGKYGYKAERGSGTGAMGTMQVNVTLHNKETDEIMDIKDMHYLELEKGEGQETLAMIWDENKDLIKKEDDTSSRGMNKYGLAAVNKHGKFYSYRNGKLTGTFDNMKDLQKHQHDLIKNEDLGQMAHKVEQDHEVQMARSDLYKAAKYSIKLHERLKNISEEEGLEGWVAAKITKASDYLSSVFHYMDYEMMSSEEMTESRTKIVQAIKAKSEQPQPTYKETISKKYQAKLEEMTKKKTEPVLEDFIGKPITEEEFEKLAEKKDACYHKVKARYKVWPSAYASGALVQCRKKGAANWGNKSKK